MNTLPARLKEARTAAGLTQVQVAERADVAQNSVSGYEIGARTPTLDVLTRLADLYGVSLDWLVGREVA